MIYRLLLAHHKYFTKLSKPNISKYTSLFELMKDRSNQLQFIQNYNQQKFNTFKNFTFHQSLQKHFNIDSNVAKQIANNTTIRTNSYSPISSNPYKISQQINNQIKIQDPVDNMEGLYKPGHTNLKYHYSINKNIPILQQYQVNPFTTYIFNLPKNTTQSSLYKQISQKLAQRTIKSLTIQHCMLGFPAYARLQLTESFIKQQFSSLKTVFSDKNILLVTEDNKQKLPLHRRQIVIKGLPQNQTPASMLQKLSIYGRILNLNLPLQTYKHQSLKQIKQLYKNQKIPIKLNFYKLNGTIQSQYYPPFQSIKQQTSLLTLKQQQYQRKLRYCQNINIYQGKQGNIQTKSKGFCIVTFSCQQQAQHCYLYLRNYYRMEVLNFKQQFQFDQKHYEALLRFIDNSYIQQCKANNPYKNYQQFQQKHDNTIFQSLFLTLVYQKMQRNYYKPKSNKKQQSHQLSTQQQIQLHYSYKQYLNKLHNSIGINNFNDTFDQKLTAYKNSHENNMYGKSLDDLIQQQLFAYKLKQNNNKQRYQVNIDDYLYPQKQAHLFVHKIPQSQQSLQIDQHMQQQLNKKPGPFRLHHTKTDPQLYATGKQVGFIPRYIMKYNEASQTANMSKGKFRRRKQALTKRLKQNLSQIQANYNKQIQQQFGLGDDQQQNNDGNQQDNQLHQQQKQQQQIDQNQQKQQSSQQIPITSNIKKKFSTTRTISKQYRSKTLKQKIISHMKYNKFIRNTINQYMGIFSSDKLQSQFHKNKPNYVNPQSLKFINGDQFITQDQVPHILQYTNLNAQQQYNQFFIQNQICKSLNINIQQTILANIQQNLSKKLHYYSQIGTVKQQYNFKGEDIQTAVKKLNIESKLGQQFKIVTDQNGNKTIAKIAKIQYLYPLQHVDTFKKIEEFMRQKAESSINQYITKLQNKQQFFTSPPPQQPPQSLQSQEITSFIEQICTKFNIPKKDFQKFMNLKNYSQQQIKKDISLQVLTSQTKKKIQAKKASDYVKDPQQINVRGKNSQAFVSKFRQI